MTFVTSTPVTLATSTVPAQQLKFLPVKPITRKQHSPDQAVPGSQKPSQDVRTGRLRNEDRGVNGKTIVKQVSIS